MPSIENREPNPQQNTTSSSPENTSVPIKPYIAEALALARCYASFRSLKNHRGDGPATTDGGPGNPKRAKKSSEVRDPRIGVPETCRALGAIRFTYNYWWYTDYNDRLMANVDNLLKKNNRGYDGKLIVILILFILNHCDVETDRILQTIKHKLIISPGSLSFYKINKFFVELDRRSIVSLDLINSHGIGQKFIQYLSIFCRTQQQVSCKFELNRIMNNKFFDACSQLGNGNSELFISLINLIRCIDHGKGFLYKVASLVKLSSLYGVNVYFGEHVPNLLAFMASQHRNCNRSVSFRHLTMAADKAGGTVTCCLVGVCQHYSSICFFAQSGRGLLVSEQDVRASHVLTSMSSLT